MLVPAHNLLHLEGKGLNVALSCLDYGRCTLSAGMLGGATRAFEQSTKWAQTRFQFHRPLADFELVSGKVARMAALCYAMDAMLYLTTGMLDREDDDIMLETAICKVFCSAMGWEVVNEAVQIMGGEGYMTENEVERILRDSRINLIVEGANEVMQSFIFGYGGKRLAESMLGVRDAVGWNRLESAGKNLRRITGNLLRPTVLRAATALVGELVLGIRRSAPRIQNVHPSLRSQADRLCRLIRDHSHDFKRASKRYGEKMISRQLLQARLADSAIWLHAFASTLSRLDRDTRAGKNGLGFTAIRRRRICCSTSPRPKSAPAWRGCSIIMTIRSAPPAMRHCSTVRHCPTAALSFTRRRLTPGARAAASAGGNQAVPRRWNRVCPRSPDAERKNRVTLNLESGNEEKRYRGERCR